MLVLALPTKEAIDILISRIFLGQICQSLTKNPDLIQDLEVQEVLVAEEQIIQMIKVKPGITVSKGQNVLVIYFNFTDFFRHSFILFPLSSICIDFTNFLDDDDDDEDEPNADENQERNDDDETSDCSLDESDIPSADSTTDVSSEHSDWGSDHSDNNAERSTEVVEKANTRQKGSSSRMPRKV